MHRRVYRSLGVLLCLCSLGIILKPSGGFGQQSRTNGLPDSSRFGYGARYYPDAPQAGIALDAAAVIQLDWLAIDFPWQNAQPSPDTAAQFDALDRIMRSPSTQASGILISITSPPAWAMLPSGPNPELVSKLLREIILRFPDRVLAFELFPAANTQRGWGAPPNPIAYAAMLQSVRSSLSDLSTNLNLVAAGLDASVYQTSAESMTDLQYLQALYAAGVASWMPILSLRLPAVQEDILALPTPGQPLVLRHYEQVRQVMLDAGHATGLLWITGFSWPASADSTNDQRLVHARWLKEAFDLLQAQLYIGAAFYSCLNSPADAAQPGCLVETFQSEPTLHPAASMLASSIYTARTGQAPLVQTFLEKQAPKSMLKYGKSR